jgi:hypothetical protein
MIHAPDLDGAESEPVFRSMLLEFAQELTRCARHVLGRSDNLSDGRDRSSRPFLPAPHAASIHTGGGSAG